MINLLSILQSKKRRPKIKQSDYTEHPKENYLSQPAPIPSNISLHRSCKTCPLSAFIEAYSNNNYTLLGTGTPEQIAEAWNEILFDWATLIKTEQSQYLFELSQNIGVLEARIIFIENAVMLLRIKWDEDLAEGIRKEGYDPADLDMVISLAKRLVFDINELKDEYTRLTNTTGGKRKSEDEFYEDIAMLSKFQAYNIDPDTTTVKKYASIFNLFLKQHSLQSKARA